MKNKIMYDLPYNLHRYILLLGMAIMGLMYVFPLADLDASEYTKHTSQADLSEGFIIMFKEVSYLLLFGVIIYFFLKEFKVISIVATFVYGVVVIAKIGIPYAKYFDYEYVYKSFETHSDSNLIMRFTFDMNEASGWGNDMLSAKRCEVGQILCVVIFGAMVVLMLVSLAMLIKVFIRKYIKKEEGEFY